MSAQVLAFKSSAHDYSSADPHGRLAGLFDRISTRARAGLTADKSSVMQFRKHAETLFMMAAKNV